MKKIILGTLLFIGLFVVVATSISGVFDDEENKENDDKASDQDAFSSDKETIDLNINNYAEYLDITIDILTQDHPVQTVDVTIENITHAVEELELRLEIKYDYTNPRCNLNSYNERQILTISRPTLSRYTITAFEVYGDPFCSVNNSIYYSNVVNVSYNVLMIEGKVRTS